MSIDTMYLNEIRSLVNAQSHENSWFIIASRLMHVDFTDLEDAITIFAFWPKEFGEIHFEVRETQTSETEVLRESTVTWVRPDGAENVVDTTNAPLNVKYVRFALLAKMMLYFQEKGEVSYAEVGKHPSNWHQCKVYLNGQPAQHVVKADAVLGRIIRYYKSGGKFVVAGDEFDTQDVRGAVRIQIIDTQEQAFF